WKSRDRGHSWTQLGPGNTDSIGLCALSCSQDSPPIIIQGSQLDTGLLARTTDEGQSWRIMLHGHHSSDEVEVPKVVFSWWRSVAIGTRWPTMDSALVASSDAGITWKALPTPPKPWALDFDQRAEMLSK